MSEALLPFAVSGALSGLGSYFGGQAAANASTKAANQANQRWNQALGYDMPYIQAGQAANNLYGNAVGTNGSTAQQQYYQNFQNDPGFQSEVNYGNKQIAAQAASQGQNLSGNTMTALQGYGQTMLSNEYQTRLNDLFREANIGATSANTALNSSTGASNVVSSAMQNAGTATGNSYQAIGNQGANTTNNLGQYYYG